MSDELRARVATLEAALAAARRTIDVLASRIERPAAADRPDQFAIHRTIASLERTVQARTEAQRASEAHYRVLYDQIPEAVLTLDDSGRVIECNRGAERILDIPSARLVGAKISELLASTSESALNQMLGSDLSGTHTAELRTRDERLLSLSLARLAGDRVILVIRDITERRALEDELQGARRLASVGRLAAALAREINNPVAVLNGRLDLLVRQPDLSPDDLARQLAVLRDHCQRISVIARNLQTFGRPQPPDLRRVSLEEVVRSAIASVGRRLARVRITVDIQPASLSIEADRHQLEQALLNLLCLVGERSPPGRSVGVAGRAFGNGIRMSVRGEGLTLPPDLLHGLRAPLQAPEQALEQGAGLGLAIAWAIIQAHGGWLTAEPAEPAGTTLHAHLPTRVAGDEASTTVRPLVVLVVDDDHVFSSTIRWMLVDAGHAVDVVRSAEEAVTELARRRYDVVLTDYHLPDMDGEALIDAVEARWPQMASRMILTSGLLHQPLHAERYLQKPFTRSQLLGQIAAVADRK